MINNNMNNESTINDVLEAVNTFSTKVDERFDKVDERFDKVEGRLGSLEGDVSSLKGDVAHIKNVMVTKEYLDDKLADLRGDLVVLTRKEDNKLKVLVEILKTKEILTPEDAQQVLKMEPFALV